MYKSIDGKWVTLVASSDAIFKRLCTAINRPEWISNPNYSSNPNRCLNANEIDQGISQWFASNTFMAISKTFDESAIPYTKVYDILDVLNDPQVIARKGIIDLLDADLGTIPAPCRVPRVPGILDASIKTGPNTGEDNLSFYKDLGLSENEISELQKNKII
jgi:crotonobetainyl-CoA:carnitine CoA-transferase CaiB-like acyl-CoA transferase